MSRSSSQWERYELADAYWFQEGPGVRQWQFQRQGIKLLNVANITTSGTIDLDKTDRYLSVEEVESKYKHFLVDEGDLVIASSGISFDSDGFLRTRGAFVQKEHLPLCMNTSTIRFKSKENFSDLRFLKYWLDSAEFRLQISRFVTGSAQLNFGPSHLKETSISLPSLPEQQRIAAILDRADRLRRMRRYAAQLSETFLQAVFVRMFGDARTNPMGWDIISLGDDTIFLTSGARGYAQYYAEEGDIFLRVENVGHSQLLLDNLVYVRPPDNAESKRISVQENDLLLSMTADLGRTAVVPHGFPKAFINQHLGLVRLKNMNPVFVSGFMSAPGGQRQFKMLDRGGVKSGLNFDDVNGYKIFNPPLALQEKFARIVLPFERLRAQQREAERQAEHLFRALLQRAFGSRNLRN
jgi:type I restriction enzyme S subunit